MTPRQHREVFVPFQDYPKVESPLRVSDFPSHFGSPLSEAALPLSCPSFSQVLSIFTRTERFVLIFSVPESSSSPLPQISDTVLWGFSPYRQFPLLLLRSPPFPPPPLGSSVLTPTQAGPSPSNWPIRGGSPPSVSRFLY